jgi:hypothetical protein
MSSGRRRRAWYWLASGHRHMSALSTPAQTGPGREVLACADLLAWMHGRERRAGWTPPPWAAPAGPYMWNRGHPSNAGFDGSSKRMSRTYNPKKTLSRHYPRVGNATSMAPGRGVGYVPLQMRWRGRAVPSAKDRTLPAIESCAARHTSDSFPALLLCIVQDRASASPHLDRWHHSSCSLAK